MANLNDIYLPARSSFVIYKNPRDTVLKSFNLTVRQFVRLLTYS